jgi:hypothetical protein
LRSTTKVTLARRGGYATTDPLEEVLRPGYFRASGGVAQVGELI